MVSLDGWPLDSGGGPVWVVLVYVFEGPAGLGWSGCMLASVCVCVPAGLGWSGCVRACVRVCVCIRGPCWIGLVWLCACMCACMCAYSRAPAGLGWSGCVRACVRVCVCSRAPAGLGWSGCVRVGVCVCVSVWVCSRALLDWVGLVVCVCVCVFEGPCWIGLVWAPATPPLILL